MIEVIMVKCKQCGGEMEFCCDACRTNWHHKVYELGSWFYINDEYYMLASAAPNHLVLVDLNGHRYKDAIKTLENTSRGISRAMVNAMVDGEWEETTWYDARDARDDNYD